MSRKYIDVMWKAHKTIREPYLWANLPPTTIIRIGTDLLCHVYHSEDTFFLKKKNRKKGKHIERSSSLLFKFIVHTYFMRSRTVEGSNLNIFEVNNFLCLVMQLSANSKQKFSQHCISLRCS